MIGMWIKRAIFTAIGGFVFKKAKQWWHNRENSGSPSGGPYTGARSG